MFNFKYKEIMAKIPRAQRNYGANKLACDEIIEKDT